MVPSGSLDPAVEALTVSAAVPLLGVTLSLAIGGWFGAVTVTVKEAEALAPALSVTVAFTMNDPAVE